MKNIEVDLIKWAAQYETAKFIETDPIQIPHRYDSKVNIEISAFVTAWLSWGSRSQIIKKADFIDQEIFKGNPYQYIVGKARIYYAGAAKPENEIPCYVADWGMYYENKDILYRTYTMNDFYILCERLAFVYRNYPDMETYLKSICEELGCTPISALSAAFGMVKGIPNNESDSACKRLNMFLRWMVRPKPVDFGIWNIITPGCLVIPLDTHVHRVALKLGITTKRTANIQTAREITNYMDTIFPDDPCKGDFALFGYGIDNPKKKVVKTNGDIPKVKSRVFKGKIEDLTISDVLQLNLFYANLKTVITELIAIRNKARDKAKAPLLAHPIDSLQKKGLLDTGQFTVEYAEVLNKVSKLPSAERKLISAIGGEAFTKTMKTITDNEKKRDNSNGTD